MCLKSQGPVFADPLNTPADIVRLSVNGAIDRLKYVGEAITLTRRTIDGKVPLIGFSGAPVNFFQLNNSPFEISKNGE